MTNTYLCVLELLFDFIYETTTNFANKAAEEELRADLTRPSDCPADAHQCPDLVRPQITNARHKRQVVERDIKLARLKIGRICGRSGRVDFKIVRLEFSDEVQEGAAEVGKEPIVLLLDCICENIIFLEEVAVVDVKCGELVFTHSMDLLDVHEFPVSDLGKIAIRCRGGCQSHFFGKAE